MVKPRKITFNLYSAWIFVIVALFFYSFTQIDLGLTLIRFSFWPGIQKNFQSIGYFNRPLSTALYLGILFLLFGFYLLLLRNIQEKRLRSSSLWKLILATMAILWFSYPAFSHDIFNYIFDAKIVAFYHQNPYQVKPLDFPADPMLGFMHWTHRPSIYPPLWIGLSVFPFFLGLGKFILQLLSFKLMISGAYLGTVWLIWKIAKILTPKKKMLSVAFYALNPLVLIESLVSAHNDGVMIFFAFLGFYLLLKRKKILSLLPWLFSMGIKFITAALLPVFGFTFWQAVRRKRPNGNFLVKLSLVLLSFSVIFVSYRIGFQPWYLLWILPFMALVAFERRLYLFLFVSLFLGTLLRYTPFLYLGNWDPPVPEVKLKLTLLFLIAGVIFYFLGLAKEKIIEKKTQN